MTDEKAATGRCSLKFVDAPGLQHVFNPQITVPGKPSRIFDSLACGSKPFVSLEWLGFVSLASKKTAFYLDNIDLSCSDIGK